MKFFSFVALNLALLAQNAAVNAQAGCPADDNPPSTCRDLDQNGEVGGRAWYDATGPTGPNAGPPDCDWYGAYWDRCQRDGNQHEKFGLVACEACCACGGGVIDTPEPTRPPTRSPTAAPTRAPRPPTRAPVVPTRVDFCSLNDNPSPNCEDLDQNGEVGGRAWYDATGPTGPNAGPPDCDWYGSYWDRCQRDGSQHENFGLVACEACCVCGGGREIERIDYLDQFRFRQNKDSTQNNLARINDFEDLEEIAQICALSSSCAGFNSKGQLKSFIKSSLTNINTCDGVDYDECGLYIKR